jgi:hypothetical protein
MHHYLNHCQDKLGFGGNDLGSDALKAKLNSLDMDELAIELQVGVPKFNRQFIHIQ